MNNTQKIKQIIAKIDTEKINGYLQEHPKSKTLKQIIGYKKRVLDSINDQEIFKLAVRLAYSFDMIVNKADYVKNEAEKNH